MHAGFCVCGLHPAEVARRCRSDMEKNLDLFFEMLGIDSTSSSESAFSGFLKKRLYDGKCRVESFEVGDGTENLLFSWGDPKVVFCTHLDTVPPYIPPVMDDGTVRGRGSCDAKGQIFSMYNACRTLAKEGETGFGLLLLAGEETGSFGAKSFRTMHPGAPYVIVGEPTDNCMASASKGTKSFGITIHGRSAHSGYPEYGTSAVDLFVDFMERLRQIDFGTDPELGATTYNVGKLESANPQNVLSDRLSFRLYFRTTFVSDTKVSEVIQGMECDAVSVKAFGGDTPTRYLTLEGFPSKPVAFGSDAPQLTNFRSKILCGPGSILVAHTPSEHILLEDLKKAEENYVRMFRILKNNI